MNAHKSDTHDERYYHIHDSIEVEGKKYIREYKAGTVFFRKEEDGNWHASVARCSVYDNFCKRQGRSVSHRKYFQGKRINVGPFLNKAPSYDDAVGVYMNPEVV